MKRQMRVNTQPAHVGKRHTNHKRVAVKTHWINAVAGSWLKDQPPVVQETLTKHICQQ